jgi:hypothetical protein
MLCSVNGGASSDGCFLFGGKPLSGDVSLLDLNIQSGSTLDFCGRLRGGMDGAGDGDEGGAGGGAEDDADCGADDGAGGGGEDGAGGGDDAGGGGEDGAGGGGEDGAGCGGEDDDFIRELRENPLYTTDIKYALQVKHMPLHQTILVTAHVFHGVSIG